MRPIILVSLAAIALGGAAPAPHQSAFDFQYAPTAEGRKSYIDYVAATFGPMVTLVPICQLRPQKWADTLGMYVVAVLSGPIKGSGEDALGPAEVRYGTAAVKFAETGAAQDYLHDPGGAFGDLRKDPSLSDADRAVKAVNTPADPSDPWAGFGK
jgi:hypothetical protein